MAGPWEKYGGSPPAPTQPTRPKPWEKYSAPQQQVPQRAQSSGIAGALEDVGGVLGQAGLGVLEGVSSLPGLPVEAGVFLGNVAGQVAGKPWRPIEDDPVLAKWGARGWYDSAQRNLGVPEGPAPSGEVERIARKAGIFAGGALPFGPAGMVPSATATAGSEVGRVTDKAGVTGGYGEAVGALAGGLAPGLVRGQLRAGVSGDAPTNETLRALAKQAYKTAEDAGVVLNSTGLTRLARNIRATLGRLAFRPKLQPRIAAFLDEIDGSIQAGNVTLQDLETLRRVAINAAKGSADDTEKMMAGNITDRIDDFMDNIQPGEVVAGDAAIATKALSEARPYWKQLRKSELVDEAVTNAELRAASTGTGGNVDNALRQNIRAILTNKKKSAMFTREEKALMVRVARGTLPHNILRMVGTLSPDKGMLSLAGNLAAASVAGPQVLLGSAAAALARRGAEGLTQRNIQRLSEAVRRGPKSAPAISRQARIAAELKRRAELAAKSGAQSVPGQLAYTEDERNR